MRFILRFFKRIYFFNAIRRILSASRYFNKKYFQILQWGFTSNEYTNFTYYLTPGNVQYLAQTLAVVTNVDFTTIMNYIYEVESDEELKSAIISAINQSPEGRYADKEVRFGRRLGWYAMVRILKPKVVIETGIDKGLGSIILCAALLRNKKEGFDGRYYGTDINPKAGYLLSGKYKEVGEVLYGDSIESLKKFDKKIDLFINDSDHSEDYEYQEYCTIKDMLGDKAVILGDNAHCTTKLSEFSFETGRKFLLFHEEPLNFWYPGAAIGFSFKAEN
ncbi:MAG: class I SAM-dependent methyltransferase [Bacteroidales bacterium]|nr:class I SAM-dependent methyltransferase [Bacteroidales bacterium]MBN2820011.1 class I SAM-dependent methyltransferase [Bacteroidales bacterium]